MKTIACTLLSNCYFSAPASSVWMFFWFLWLLWWIPSPTNAPFHWRIYLIFERNCFVIWSLIAIFLVFSMVVGNTAASALYSSRRRPSSRVSCLCRSEWPDNCNWQWVAAFPGDFRVSRWKCCGCRRMQLILINNRPTALQTHFWHKNYGSRHPGPEIAGCSPGTRRRRARRARALIISSCS